MPNLKSLNLSENKLTRLPDMIKNYLPQIELINLNNNQFEDIYATIDALGNLRALKQLYINLNQEEQVDYILEKMPLLEQLNGLPVDRDELYEDNETANEGEKSDRGFSQYANENSVGKDNLRQGTHNKQKEYDDDRGMLFKDDLMENRPLQLMGGSKLNNMTSMVTASPNSRKQGPPQIGPNNNTANLLNQSRRSSHYTHQMTSNDTTQDLINADEFEEIAEIYDSIRLMHQKLNPSADQRLAEDFDAKLKQVMEGLSDAVNNHEISIELKRERSLYSKFELFTVCSEKMCDYFRESTPSPSKNGSRNPPISNIVSAIFDGYKSIINKYQEGYMETLERQQPLFEELEKNKEETHQLLEAAEHLEKQNISNAVMVDQLAKEKDQVAKQCQQLQEENKKYQATIKQMQQQQVLLQQQIKALNDNAFHQQTRQHQASDQQSNFQEENMRGSMTSRQQVVTDQQQFNSNTNANRKSSPSPIGGRPLTSRIAVHNLQNSIKKKQLASVLGSHRPSSSNGGSQNISPLRSNKQDTSLSFHQRIPSENQQNSTFNNNIALQGGVPTQSQQLQQKRKPFIKNIQGMMGPSQNRVLSLKQLKDMINDIYLQKTKFDQRCEDSHQARETMEQFMYTYLNQRYGLKNLIIEWAAAIIGGIKKFSKEDHDVALFGKILRNECDEEFRFVQTTVKDTVYALLKAVFREKMPTKNENDFQKLVDGVSGGFIESWQWKKIIEKMYDDEDYRQLQEIIYAKVQQQQLEGDLSTRSTSQTRNSSQAQNNNNSMMNKIKKATRNEITKIEQESQIKLKFTVFLKAVLDFQLKEHERFLARFLDGFKKQDSDHNGLINESEFITLMNGFSISRDRVRNFLQAIDPYSNEKITFSECVHLLSSETILDEEGREISILEKIAQDGSSASSQFV